MTVLTDIYLFSVCLCSPGSGSCRFSYSDPRITVSYSLSGNANSSEDWITLETIRSLPKPSSAFLLIIVLPFVLYLLVSPPLISSLYFPHPALLHHFIPPSLSLCIVSSQTQK